jgi:hypothetical protein
VLTAGLLVAVGYAIWLGYCVRNARREWMLMRALDAANEPMGEGR